MDVEAERVWRTVLRGPMSPSGGLGVNEVVEKLSNYFGAALGQGTSALLDQRDLGKVTLEGFKLFAHWFGLDPNSTPYKVNAILDLGFARPLCYYSSDDCNKLLGDKPAGTWVLRYSQSADTVLFAISRVEDRVVHRKVFYEPGSGFCLSVDKGYFVTLHELLLDSIYQCNLMPKSLGATPQATTSTYASSSVGGYSSSNNNNPPQFSPTTTTMKPGTNSYSSSSTLQQNAKWEIPSSELVKEVLVGKGGFGEVYRGRWRGSSVAIKVMIGVPKPEEALQFKNEAALLTNLRPHSNVVQFFGVAEIPNLCIITEFLEGGSLDHLLKVETFNNRQLVRMAADTAAGMLHLHKEGIVHRDLAARNLLVKKIQGKDEVYYEIKVTDFGLSRKNMTGTTKADLPVKWSAPESLQNGSYSYKSDIWSYGIVLWEMLHKGEEPYEEMTVIQIFEGVTKAGLRPPIPPQAPRVFHEIMPKTWQLNPSDRPDFDKIQHIISSAMQQNDYNPPANKSPASSNYGSSLSRPPASNDPYEEQTVTKPPGYSSYGSALSRPPNASSPKAGRPPATDDPYDEKNIVKPASTYSKGSPVTPTYGSGLVRPATSTGGDDPYGEKNVVKPPSAHQPKSGSSPMYGSALVRPAAPAPAGDDPYGEKNVVKPPSSYSMKSSPAPTYGSGLVRPPTQGGGGGDDPYGEKSVVKPPSAYSKGPAPTYGSGLVRPPTQGGGDDPYDEKDVVKPASAYQPKAPPAKASMPPSMNNDPYEENTIVKPRTGSGIGLGGQRGLAPKAAPKVVMGGNRVPKK